MPEVKEPIEKFLTSIFRAPDYLSIELILDQYFSQVYRYLRRFYLPPLTTVKNLQRNEYFERKWLENQLEKFIQEENRGFFILEGAGGTGKTTFLAQWTFQHGAIHHFFEFPGQPDYIDDAKGSLGSQIVRRFYLSDLVSPSQFEELYRRSSFLNDILIEVSRQEKISSNQVKVFIVIDGFDEIGLMDGLRELGISDDLPENVYFIVSQQPQVKKLRTKAPLKTIYLGTDSPYHLSELKLFCLNELSKNIFSLSKSPLSPDQLSDIIIEKSNGNWIALFHLIDFLKEIKDKNITAELLHSLLPDSLCRCYLHAFNNLKEMDHTNWYHNLLPLLGVLATYQENVSIDQLASLTKQKIEERVIRNYLDQVLEPFILSGPKGEFNLRHFSMREFLSGNLEKGNCSLQEEAFLDELVENTRNFHMKIAQEILFEWGGIENKLNKLQQKETITPLDMYGLDHLASHLIGAKYFTDLKALINMQQENKNEGKRQTKELIFPFLRKGGDKKETSTTPRFVNIWYQIKLLHDRVNRYREDVHKTFEICDSAGEQVRYALILSSVSSLTNRAITLTSIGDQEEKDQVIVNMAVYLAKSGDTTEAINTLGQIKNNRLISQAYIEIANYVPSNTIPTILRFCYILDDPWSQTQIIHSCALRLAELRKPAQAIDVARQIPVENHRNQLLAQLAEKLFIENQFDLALDAIHSIKNNQMQVDLLSQYANSMDRESLQTALSMVWASQNNIIKVQGLARLAPNLSPSLLKEAIRLCQQINNEEHRGNALAGIIPYLDDTLLKDAIGTIREIKDENLRAPALVALTIRTAEAENPDKAFRLILAILGENPKAAAIAGVVPFMNDDQRAEVFEIVKKFKDPGSQARALESLIPFMNKPDLDDILPSVQDIKNEAWFNILIKAIAKRYIEINEPAKAIELVQLSKSPEYRIKLLIDLIQLLPLHFRGQILTIAQAFDLPAQRISALFGIAPALKGEELATAISIAIDNIVQHKQDRNLRMADQTKLLALLTQQGEYSSAFKILREINDDESIAKSVSAMLPHLPEEFHGIIWERIDRIQETRIKVSTLIEIAPNLPPIQTIYWLRKLQDIDDGELFTKAFVGLAPHAGHEHLQEILEFIHTIEPKELRSQAFKAITPLWTSAPKALGSLVWKETLINSAKRTRPHFLSDLQSLAPIIYHIGGNTAIKEVLLAIHDIFLWWG